MDSDTVKMDGAMPLTVLSEEEQLFRTSIRDFGEEQIKPLVAGMDAEAPDEILAAVSQGAALHAGLDGCQRRRRRLCLPLRATSGQADHGGQKRREAFGSEARCEHDVSFGLCRPVPSITLCSCIMKCRD